MSFSLTHFKASVVVTSDTCSLDPTQDTSGEYVVEQLKSLKFMTVSKFIVPDEKEVITKIVKEIVDDPDNALTITVGGTGLCPRDVTPEATSILYDKDCSGIAVALHMTSLRYTPKAALSRLTAGISKSCLIINFPGKEKACKDCFLCLVGFLEHALEQIRFNARAIENTHRKLMENQTSNLYDRITDERDVDTSKLCFETVLSTADYTDFDSSKATIGGDQVSNDLDIPTKLFKKMHLNHSPYPLLNYDTVLNIMTGLICDLRLNTKDIPLDSLEAAFKTLGSILASDLNSKRIIPAHRASTMDGYLLNVPNNMLNKLNVLKTVQAIFLQDLYSFQKAQLDPILKNKFFCCQINTGGRVTTVDGCFVAVVPFESTSSTTSNIKTVSISNIQMNKFIREIGSDLNERDFLRAGTVIGPPELAIILSMGYSSVKVIDKTSIGLFSSGNELVEPFVRQTIDLDKVMDVNNPLLSTLYKSRGFEAISLGILKDDPLEIAQRITTSLKKHDVLVITGGASMGTGDHMKNVILEMGGTIHFGRVNIKPGKPAALASLVIDEVRKFVFCLPGNPVSAYITSLVLVLPFLEQGIRNHLGHNSSGLSLLQSLGELVEVQLASITDVETEGSDAAAEYVFEGRLEFVRATRVKSETWDMKSPPQVSVSIKQQSSRLLSLRDCDWIIIIEPSLKDSKFLVGQLYPALQLK